MDTKVEIKQNENLTVSLTIDLTTKNIVEILKIEKSLDLLVTMESFWVKGWTNEMKEGNGFNERIKCVKDLRDNLRLQIKGLLPDNDFND